MSSTVSATEASPDDIGHSPAAVERDRARSRDRERHRVDDHRTPRLPADWGDPFSLTSWLLPDA